MLRPLKNERGVAVLVMALLTATLVMMFLAPLGFQYAFLRREHAKAQQSERMTQALEEMVKALSRARELGQASGPGPCYQGTREVKIKDLKFCLPEKNSGQGSGQDGGLKKLCVRSDPSLKSATACVQLESDLVQLSQHLFELKLRFEDPKNLKERFYVYVERGLNQFLDSLLTHAQTQLATTSWGRVDERFWLSTAPLASTAVAKIKENSREAGASFDASQSWETWQIPKNFGHQGFAFSERFAPKTCAADNPLCRACDASQGDCFNLKLCPPWIKEGGCDESDYYEQSFVLYYGNQKI